MGRFTFTDLSRREGITFGSVDPALNARREDRTGTARATPWSGPAWGTADLHVFVITKDELRGWIRALEWVIGGGPR